MAERRAQVVRSGRLTAAVVLLALSSGAVDALGFIGLGAVFASVMTGNLVLLGIAVVQVRLYPALAAGTAIVAYVAGVFGTSAWLRRVSPPPPRAAAETTAGSSRCPPAPARQGGRHSTWRALLRRTPPRQGGDRDAWRVLFRRTPPRRGVHRDTWGALFRRTPRRRGVHAGYARTRRGPARRAVARPLAYPRHGRSRSRRPGRAAPGPARTPDGGVQHETPDPHPGGRAWSGRVRQALVVVPVAQAAVLAGWLACHGRPGEAPLLLLLGLSAFAMGVQSAGVNTLPLTGAATTYLTGTLTTLTTELATSGVPPTMRRRFALLVAAFAGAALSGTLLTWARPTAPALPLAATLAALLVVGPGR